MTWRNKNILLITGFIVSLILAYKLSFSKTIEIQNKVKVLEDQKMGFDDIATLSSNLKFKEKYIDSVLASNNLKKTSLQNSLLNVLNDKSQGIDFSIINFSKPHIVTENSITSTSYQFTLEGDYLAIENALYTLEQEYNFGRIVHLSFEKKRDYRTRRNYLECLAILENYISAKR